MLRSPEMVPSGPNPKELLRSCGCQHTEVIVWLPQDLGNEELRLPSEVTLK